MKIGKIIRAMAFSILVYIIELAACYIIAALNQKSFYPYKFSVTCLNCLIGCVLFFTVLLPIEIIHHYKNN